MAILSRMDELVIDEKKYVSTKRAAKETGYAKDYVGQLCREGRVPARLVGRSWYVLEAAIKDHRFGAPVSEETTPQNHGAGSASILPPTWDLPRYSSVAEPELPTINRLKEQTAPNEPAASLSLAENAARETPQAPAELHEAWQEWFSLRKDAEEEATAYNPAELEGEQAVENSGEDAQSKEEGSLEDESQAEFVPIHALQADEVRKIRPTLVVAPSVSKDTAPHVRKAKKGNNRLGTRILIATGLTAAVISLAVAVLNSGYADQYVQSFTQASVITGLSIYNK